MRFGDISKFYSYMKDTDKVAVAKSLSKNKNIFSNELNTYLKMIGVYRNILAHDERFYEYQKKRNNQSPYNINFKGFLGFNNVISSVFALTICLKILLNKNDFDIFFKSFFKEIKTLESSLHSIPIDDILKKMNFIIHTYNLYSLGDIEKLFS